MRMTPDDYSMILRESGCFDFLHQSAEAAANEILSSCPEGAALLSEEAEQDLERGLCARMEMVYLHPLLKELTWTDPSLKLSQSSESREKWMEAASRLAKLSGGVAGRKAEEKYPLIREYAAKIRENYISGASEMLRSVVKHSEELSERFLDAAPLRRISSISADSGDMHRHGRAVRRIAAGDGAFYYKPGDCRMHSIYSALVKSMFPDCILAPGIVCGDGCGFEEEMKPKELDSLQQASVYFHNLGMLMALFHALGSTDMHFENIMACGVMPAAIDLETLVRGRISPSAFSDNPRRTPLTDAENDMYYSVESVGMLPNTIIKGVYVSTLHKGTSPRGSLPKYGGEELDIEGREEDFIEGFREGYDRILADKGRILELFRDAGGMQVRYVPHNTAYFYILRTRLFRCEALEDTEGRGTILKKLEVPFTGNNLPVSRKMVDHEAECLKEGDIPYFCCSFEGHALCGEDTGSVLVEDYLQESASEVMKLRLERFSPRERDFETELIRRRLTCAPLPETEVIQCPELPETAMSARDARALCSEMLSRLESSALTTSSGATVFLSGILAIEKQPGCGIATQQADAALFCASVMSAPVPEDLRGRAEKIAERCVGQLEGYVRTLEGESGEYLLDSIPLGLSFGLGGILRSAAAAADAGVAGAEELTRAVLGLISDKKLYRDRRVSGGEAGLILALSALQDHLGDDPRVPVIVGSCGGSLLSCPSTDIPVQQALRGAALTEAYRLSGEERFRQAAEEDCLRLKEAYLPHIPGWAAQKPAIAWLGVSGGQEGAVAICAMIAEGASAGSVAAQVRELAMDSIVRRHSLLRSDTLSDGNALSAMAFIMASRLSGESGDILRAGRVLSAMAARREKYGSFIVSPPGIRSFFDVSVRYGTLGVGCTLSAYLGEMERCGLSDPFAGREEPAIG